MLHDVIAAITGLNGLDLDAARAARNLLHEHHRPPLPRTGVCESAEPQGSHLRKHRRGQRSPLRRTSQARRPGQRRDRTLAGREMVSVRTSIFGRPRPLRGTDAAARPTAHMGLFRVPVGVSGTPWQRDVGARRVKALRIRSERATSSEGPGRCPSPRRVPLGAAITTRPTALALICSSAWPACMAPRSTSATTSGCSSSAWSRRRHRWAVRPVG